VSNPPYIALGEAASLPAGVRDWEPAVALFSGADGMTATRCLVREAADALAAGGLFALEVDARRASLGADGAAFEGGGSVPFEFELDLTEDAERFVLARRQETDGDDRG
jgi:release factor glutamine methyltransferase